MSWFGEPDNRPLLGADSNSDDKKAKQALENEGHKTFKMTSTYCDGCGGEDGNHVPDEPCDRVN